MSAKLKGVNFFAEILQSSDKYFDWGLLSCNPPPSYDLILPSDI